MSLLDILTMFLMFLPKTFFENVVLVETNKKIEEHHVTSGEFLQFIGCSCQQLQQDIAILTGLYRSQLTDGKVHHFDSMIS
jgi:hypothetical protein